MGHIKSGDVCSFTKEKRKKEKEKRKEERWAGGPKRAPHTRKEEKRPRPLRGRKAGRAGAQSREDVGTAPARGSPAPRLGGAYPDGGPQGAPLGRGRAPRAGPPAGEEAGERWVLGRSSRPHTSPHPTPTCPWCPHSVQNSARGVGMGALGDGAWGKARRRGAPVPAPSPEEGCV